MRMICVDNKSRDEFCRLIQQIDINKPFVAEFKVYRRRRTLAQNKLYRLWLTVISKELGDDEGSLHEFFVRKFLAWDSKEIFGEEIAIRRSTADLNTKEFTDYLEQIKMFVLNYGIYLPEPGEQGFDQMHAQYGG